MGAPSSTTVLSAAALLAPVVPPGACGGYEKRLCRGGGGGGLPFGMLTYIEGCIRATFQTQCDVMMMGGRVEGGWR